MKTLLDIAMTNCATDTINVLLNKGNGSLSKSQKYFTHGWPKSIETTDFNNDKHLDIIVANTLDYTLTILLGDGHGSFSELITFSSYSEPVSLATGDLNGDNRVDIAVINYMVDDLRIFFATDNNSFSHTVAYPLEDNPIIVEMTKINDDNYLDIIVSTNARNLIIFLGYGNGSFSEKITHSTISLTSSISIGDFNHDHRVDFVISNYQDNSFDVILSYPNKVFIHRTTLTNEKNNTQPQAIAVADFNHDNHMDIIVTHSSTNQISMYLGHDNYSFTQQFISTNNSSPQLMTIGHLNNDIHLDVIITNRHMNGLNILFGDGNGSFTHQNIFFTAFNCYPSSITVVDITNDTCVDIIIVDSNYNMVCIYSGHCNGTFTELISFSTGYGSYPFALAVADFNDDKKSDFVIANKDSDSLRLYLQTC